MSIESVRPTTLVGIKRLARDIKAAQGVPHATALDLAAKQARFANFRHAQQALPARSQSPEFKLWLTAYWVAQSGESGRETLAITLPSPWASLGTRNELRRARALAAFKFFEPDHLVADHLLQTQEHARSSLCAAARTMQFMCATGMRPVKWARKAYPAGADGTQVPGQDHASVWLDPTTGKLIIADEPYEEALPTHAAKRAAWASRHGYRIEVPSWPGMYNPHGGARLHLMAPAALEPILTRAMVALASAAPPITPAPWTGESGPYRPTFASPGQLAAGAVAKPYTPPNLALRRKGPNTAGYIRTFVGAQRRPDARMPLALHAEAGRLLSEVFAAAYHRKGVCNRVDRVRSELDEWVQREYTYAELPMEEFAQLYYGEKDRTFARSLSAEQQSRFLVNLERVKEILSSSYPDCAPCREMLKQLDAAIGSLQTWGTRSD